MNPYRQIPKVDKILNDESFKKYNRYILSRAVKEEIKTLREDISKGKEWSKQELYKNIKRRYYSLSSSSLYKVINATGIIIHTNLGRSPIDSEVFDSVKEIATNYCNLEYDMQKGSRGDRYTHTAQTLKELFGCEDVLIVNNNASAVFLILNTFAKNKEVIVSRGELVEIGGSFRIPEVMRASGAILKEVGTTNRTKISDYKESISENSSMLMKVHKSNYKIVGFSQDVEIDEITKLAKERNLIDYYDLGSAYIPPLPYSLSNSEPSIMDILKNSPSLVSFSGDKLFGSIQAGIIIGKKELIAKLKKNQILRMFRVDKITLAILQQTAISYLKNEYEKIPVLNMLFTPIEELEKRAESLIDMIQDGFIYHTSSFVGGGTMPEAEIPSVSVALKGNAKELQEAFRRENIIGRIENEMFLIDMRTVKRDDISVIAKAYNKIKE